MTRDGWVRVLVTVSVIVAATVWLGLNWVETESYQVSIYSTDVRLDRGFPQSFHTAYPNGYISDSDIAEWGPKAGDSLYVYSKWNLLGLVVDLGLGLGGLFCTFFVSRWLARWLIPVGEEIESTGHWDEGKPPAPKV